MKLSERLDWLEEVLRIMRGDTVAVTVAVAMQRRENHKTGKLNPSYATIARDCGFDHRDTARRAIKRLREGGLLDYRETYGGARQNTNEYTLTRRCSAPGLEQHRVPEPPVYPAPSSTTIPAGNPDDAGAPLEAAPGVSKQYFRSQPKEKPTKEQKAVARRHTAAIIHMLEAEKNKAGA